jgi:hypothetical protein
MRSSVYVRFYPTAGVDHRVDPKLANTTPVEQGPRVLCPGWPAGSPTPHSSELANEHRAGSRGAALEEIFGSMQFMQESHVSLRR